MAVHTEDNRKKEPYIRETVEKGKIMAPAADRQETVFDPALAPTSVARETLMGNADVVAHAHPGTPAWGAMMELKNGDNLEITVNAPYEFLDHMNKLRRPGDTFEAPNHYVMDWVARGMVSLGGESHDMTTEDGAVPSADQIAAKNKEEEDLTLQTSETNVDPKKANVVINDVKVEKETKK